MHKTLLLFSLLICSAESNWGTAGDRDPSQGPLGFSAFNMTCNEEGSSCQQSFNMAANGKIFMISTNYTTDPFKLHLHISDEDNDWNMYIVQDHNEDYRWCDNAFFTAGLSNTFSRGVRFSMCTTNRFTGISVPDSCPKPVALVDLDAHEYDEKIRGQQMLYCL